MLGLALSLTLSSVLFIHLGLGEAIAETMRLDFILLRCSKCLSFWASLIALLLAGAQPVRAILIAFLMAYLSLWIDLGLLFMNAIYGKASRKARKGLK